MELHLHLDHLHKFSWRGAQLDAGKHLPLLLHRSEISVSAFLCYIWKWDGRKVSIRAVTGTILDVGLSKLSDPLAADRRLIWPACRIWFTSERSLLSPICILIESGNKERLKSLSTIVRSNGDAGHKLRGKYSYSRHINLLTCQDDWLITHKAVGGCCLNVRIR
jgi:hypothetical protein